MGDEILTPEISGTGETPSRRIGITGDYSLKVPVSTSVSEKGIGHSAGVNLYIPDTFEEGFIIRPEFTISNTEMKLFPTTDSPGTTANQKHLSFKLGFGQYSRFVPQFDDNGFFRFAIFGSTTPMIGAGSSTISQPGRTMGGETFPGGESKTRTWDLSTRYIFGGEIRTGGDVMIKLGAGVDYGIQFDKEGSDSNRVVIAAPIVAEVGLADWSSATSGNTDAEVGTTNIIYALYSMGHGWAQRYMFDKTVSQPMEALSKYGLISPSSDPASMYDVPLLKAGAAFTGGMGNPLATPLRTNTGVFIALTAMRAVGGAAFMATGSTDGRAGGLADLSGSARLLGYAIAGIETPEKRSSFSPDEVRSRQKYVNMGTFILNGGMMVIGAITKSDVLMRGSGNSDVQLGMSQDPINNDMIERTDVGYIPTSLYSGTNSGHRGGVLIHSTWRTKGELKPFMGAVIMSPMLTPGNAMNMPSQDKLFADPSLPSEVGAQFGGEWKTTYTRASAGLDVRSSFGGGSAVAALGGVVRFDLTIPFNGKKDGSGIMLGVQATAHKRLQGSTTTPAGVEEKGWQAEIAPVLGATIHF